MLSRFLFSLGEINKKVLFVMFASLAYKRGHFSGTVIPGPFQILLVLSLLLTFIYVLGNHKIKDFFASIPKKIWLAITGLFSSVLIGWAVAVFYVGIPNTLHTVLDFGTFTMSLIILVLVLFYTKEDERCSKWCLYALFIPNFYILYYFLTHGLVGYWGVPNDNSLYGLVDPNVHSKALLIPALFFISLVLFALKNRKWWLVFGYVLLASIFVMLIFWTISRGSAVSLVFGAILIWGLFSAREFSWRRLLGGGMIIFTILFLGYAMVPVGAKQELQNKIANTGSLPTPSEIKITEIVRAPTITMEEMRETPRSEVRVFEWLFFAKYALEYPFGIGPSSSSFDYQGEGYLQLRPGNTYLQVWLWGGVLGILCFLYLLWQAFVSLWIKWSKSYEVPSLALFGILFALSISIVFDASLYFYWFFIILALALRERWLVRHKSATDFLAEKKTDHIPTKLVSVIIPAYNIEKYLAKTVESVIRQTYKNLEIIIINDGSTDKTKKIAQRYADKDKRIIIFEQTNKGLSAARNAGFKMANGEYFCIIDADDIMMPGKIEWQVRFLENYPEGDVVYSKVYYFMDEINSVYVRDLATETGSLVFKSLLRQGNFISPNAVLFRRRVFDRFGGFDESLRSSEDFAYWLYLSSRGVNFLHLDRYLTLCRYRKDSMTANSVAMYSSAVSAFEKYLLVSRKRLVAIFISPHYLKAKLLLIFSMWKKIPVQKNDDSNPRPSRRFLRQTLAFLFHTLRKIKFFLTFKRVKDETVQKFLNFIESSHH